MPDEEQRTADNTRRHAPRLPVGLPAQPGGLEAVLQEPSDGGSSAAGSASPGGVEHLKTEFISTVSHELRTPLTAIRGAIGLVLGGAGGPVPPPIRDLLEIASTNTERLIELVNEILEAFRMEEGKLQLSAAPASLAKLVNQACAEEQKQAEAAGVRLETRLGAHLPPAIADGEQVQTVLRKLLSNAIQFCSPGGVVRIGAEPQPGNPKFLLVWVQEYGRGMSGVPRMAVAHDAPPGHTADRLAADRLAASRPQQGSGLVLAICRGVVQAHGGQLWVESESNRGATVYLTLPVAEAARTEAQQAR